MRLPLLRSQSGLNLSRLIRLEKNRLNHTLLMVALRYTCDIDRLCSRDDWILAVFLMNELPVIGSLCSHKEFWDRHRANIVTSYKGTYGERLF